MNLYTPSISTRDASGFCAGTASRLTGTYLKKSGGGTIDGYSYGYDLAGQRTNLTRSVVGAVSSLALTYDPISQLKTALGYEADNTPRLNERFGYGYDAAGNLNLRTNNDLVQTFTVNSLNELSAVSRNTNMTVAGATTGAATNVTINALAAAIYADHTFARTNMGLVDGNNSFTAIARDARGRVDTNISISFLPASISLSCDANGNLRTNGTRIFDYDDENQLIRITEPAAWKSEFAYDGRMRRRVRKEFTWSSGNWTQTNEVHYVYDGNLTVEERDTNNAPLVKYVRGLDLSGSLQGAGGIGSLLARFQPSAPTAQTAFYHCDGSGNITCLINTNQLVVAKYLYDPYGGILGMSGPLAQANLYRFSSMEYHENSGIISYLYRYYDSSLQRWINQDPLGETGGINMYAMVGNDTPNELDPVGLKKGAEILIDLSRQGGGTIALGNVAGAIWSLPNSALGLAWGLIGLPFGAGITIGDSGSIQFINYPFEQGNLSLGHVQCYSKDLPPGDIDPDTSGFPYEGHEGAHTTQSNELGPFYLPAYMVGGIISVLNGGNFFESPNPMETGPSFSPPQPWPPHK